MNGNNLAFPQDAYGVLVDRVYAPVFLTKLANDYGVVPQTDQEQAELLELAGILREAKERGEIKTASAPQQGSLIAEASDGLKTALGMRGYDTGAPTTQGRMRKQAAAQASYDPAVQQAALEYGLYLAQLQAAASQGQ